MAHIQALLDAGWLYLSVAFDGDQAGRIGAMRFIRRWGPCFRQANIIKIPDGLDPKDLPDDELIGWSYRARL